jgi:hypothetical protein
LQGYIFNLDTGGLHAGTWQLRFRVPGDPAVHLATFLIGR